MPARLQPPAHGPVLRGARLSRSFPMKNCIRFFRPAIIVMTGLLGRLASAKTLACLICLLVGLAPSAQAQLATGTALIRRAPTLNGAVEGSIQQMTAENVTLNGGASVT